LPDDRLSEREILVYYWFRNEAGRLIEKHGGAKHVYPEYEFEEQIPATDIILTGHIDLYVECVDGMALVVDYKTGMGEVETAKRNKQALGYAWAIARHSGSALAYIFSAGNPEGERFTGTALDGYSGSLQKAERELLGICGDALNTDAKRVPGLKQCQYCQANSTDHCPESIENALQTGVGCQMMHKSLPSLPASRDTIVDVFKAIKQVKDFERVFIKRLKEEVGADPEAWSDSFELVQGKQRRSIPDVMTVYDVIVNAYGYLTAEDFRAILGLSVTALESELKKPLKDEGILIKDQKEYIAGLLGDAIKYKRDADSIRLKG
jgi:hypothetical protein